MTPRIDVTETEQAMVVTAELPGLDETDFDVSLSDEGLVLKGEKKVDKEETGVGYVYTERTFGRFERRIPITVDILADKVEAGFRNGVLTVTLPKNPHTVTHERRIAINVAAEEKQPAA
jgi:HSP20 family protein